MTIVTHLVATAVGVKALGLHGPDVALAYAFGIGQDVDHLIKLPGYLKAIRARNDKGYYLRSSLQEPVALIWIIPLAIVLGTAIPVIFFCIHLALDYSVRFEKMPFYPFSNWVTRGWLVNLSDGTKEFAVLGIALCTSLLLR